MTDQATAEFRWVPVGEIHPADDNLRRDLGDLSDLGSVATLGVLEPLLLTPRAAGGYTLVAGHRRHAAAAAAGLAQVPAMVRPYTETERLEVMLVENLQRRDLSPLEEALGYRRLLDLGLRQRALAQRLGVGQAENVFKTPSWGGDPQLRHLTDLLEATGYALTQVEVDRVTPRDAEHAGAAEATRREDGEEEEEEDQEDDVAQCPVCGGRGERHRRSCSMRSTHAPTDDAAVDGVVGEDDQEQEDVARCRVCGCSEDEPCEGGCEWVEDPLDLGDLCSRSAAEHGLLPDDGATAREGVG